MSKTREKIIEQIQNRGFRLTAKRLAVLDMFLVGSQPISAKDILTCLHKQSLKVNKTSVYREIDFLLSEGLIKKVLLNSGEDNYELNSKSHHHHLICEKCQKAVEVSLGELEKILQKLTKKFSRKNGFSNLEHNLEFFGICKFCEK